MKPLKAVSVALNISTSRPKVLSDESPSVIQSVKQSSYISTTTALCNRSYFSCIMQKTHDTSATVLYTFRLPPQQQHAAADKAAHVWSSGRLAAAASAAATQTGSCSCCEYWTTARPFNTATDKGTTAVGSLHLEALAVHDARPSLIVLLLHDPHLLEGAQRCQDGPSNPNGVLALGGGDDANLNRGRGED